MMQGRQRHGATPAPWAWPSRNTRHAGVLDFGLLGGASFDPALQSWTFANAMQEFEYGRTSPLTQMLPRQRPWEPREPEQSLIPQGNTSRNVTTSITTTINESIRHLGAMHPDEWFPEDVLHDLMSESAREDYEMAFYDPYMANLCAVGRYVGLPMVATPMGPSGAELGIMLAQHKPKQQPPFNLLAPKTSLISFPSAICQIATPSRGSEKFIEEQILVRTRDSVTIVAAPLDVPTAISRIEPAYVEVVDQIPSRPFPCKDDTIYAAISPHIPNQYALVGDRGRVAIWSRTMALPKLKVEEDNINMGETIGRRRRTPLQKKQDDIFSITDSCLKKVRSKEPMSIDIIRKEDTTEQSQRDKRDPWQSCIWGAHPSQLVLASRNDVVLLDYRSATSERTLFGARTRETVRAIQEDDISQLAPFQTYIATSHQVACIDQRFTKTPLISWAHQAGREVPSGIKVMDMVSGGRNYSTVLTWTRRNADITAYNVDLGSGESHSGPISFMGRAQEIPSFHSHSQYTNSSSLRNPLKRDLYMTDDAGRLPQPVKPPLHGLGVLPVAAFEFEDGSEMTDESSATGHQKFSLLQYSATGAVYAQEIELRREGKVGSDDEDEGRMDAFVSFSVPSDTHISTIHGGGSSGNPLVSDLARGELSEDAVEEEEETRVLDQLIGAAEKHVAPWKRGVKEAQEAADDVVATLAEVRSHVDMDLQSVLRKLKSFLMLDKEGGRGSKVVSVEAKVEEAMALISKTDVSISLLDILRRIKCANLPLSDRNAIAESIRRNLDFDPYLTTDSEIIQRKIFRVGLGTLQSSSKLDMLLREENPRQQAVAKALEDMYAMPMRCVLEADQDQRNEKSLSAGLANLSIPSSRMGSESLDERDDFDLEGDVWPSTESHLIRSRTIERLAQDLILSTMIVTRSVEPDIPTGQSMEPAARVDSSTFQYLFQGPLSGSAIRPKITLSARCRRVWGEWSVGGDPADYVYLPPEAASLSMLDSEAEMDEEEIKEREERLLMLRRRREKRENRTRAARMKDPGYNIHAGGSASQPAGVVATDHDFSQLDEADEDGMFSLPTIVSASQPAFTSRSLLTQPSQQPRPRPLVNSISSTKKPGAGSGFGNTTTSQAKSLQPTSSLKTPLARRTRERTPVGFGVQPPLSFDHAMFQPSFVSSSQDWEDTLPIEGAFTSAVAPTITAAGSSITTTLSAEDIRMQRTDSNDVGIFGGSTFAGSQDSSYQHGGSSTDLSQGWSQGLFSQNSQEDSSAFAWGASQPVRGAFANRKPVPPLHSAAATSGTGSKPKKKKNRTQGF